MGPVNCECVWATGFHLLPAYVRFWLAACARPSSGREIVVSVSPNPSHLEAVDPVVEGIVRPKQDRLGDTARERVIPVVIHGDARWDHTVASGSVETAICGITPVKSRYILLAENGNLPRNNAPPLSTASPGMTSTARGACRASSDSRLHPGSLCAAAFLVRPGGAPEAFPGQGGWWLPRRQGGGLLGRGCSSALGEATLATVHADAPHLERCWSRSRKARHRQRGRIAGSRQIW